MNVFLGEINIWVVELGKVHNSHLHGWTFFNLLRAQIKQEIKAGTIFSLLNSQSWSMVFFCPGWEFGPLALWISDVYHWHFWGSNTLYDFCHLNHGKQFFMLNHRDVCTCVLWVPFLWRILTNNTEFQCQLPFWHLINLLSYKGHTRTLVSLQWNQV